MSSHLFKRPAVDTMCTVTVRHTDESLEAHVELDNGLLPTSGDKVRVFGAPIRVDYGGTLELRREARLIRGNVLDKIWQRIIATFEMTELYEVSFTPGSLK